MKTWAEFKNTKHDPPPTLEIVNVACPQCGDGTPIYRRTDVVLATYPPMYNYECLKCGWFGVA